MLRLRLILTWLVLAALPLQGWAAAAMLYCGPAHKAAVQARAHSHDAASQRHMHTAPHDNQGTHGHHAGTVDSAHADDAGTPVADGTHTCGVCAACCHGAALTQTPQWPAVSAVPRADLAEPLFAVRARPSPVPDKPPRA